MILQVISLFIIITSTIWISVYSGFSLLNRQRHASALGGRIKMLCFSILLLQFIMFACETGGMPCFTQASNVTHAFIVMVLLSILAEITGMPKPFRYLLYIIFLCPLLFVLPFPLTVIFSAEHLILTALLLILSGMFYITGRINQNQFVRDLAVSLNPGIIILSFSVIIKKAAMPETFNSAVYSLITVYTSYIFASFHNRYFSKTMGTAMKARLAGVLVTGYSVFFMMLLGTLFLHMAVGDFFVSSIPECMKFAGVSSAVIYLLALLAWNVISRLDTFFYPAVNDFAHKLRLSESYIKNILVMNELVSFIDGLFTEFFSSKKTYLMIVSPGREGWIRTISREKDVTARIIRDADAISDLFSEIPFARVYGTVGNPFKSIAVSDDITTFIKIKHGGDCEYILGLAADFLIPFEELLRIHSASAIFGTVADNILIYEKKRSNIIERIKTAEKYLDTNGLKNENLELQRSYEKIRQLQDDLLIKEKKAALTKFSISLDDEISNPISNMSMTLQYNIEKIKSGSIITDAEKARLMDTIISQAVRIKFILDELRSATEHCLKKDNKN